MAEDRQQREADPMQGVQDGVASKRGSLLQGAGTPQVGRREAPQQTADPNRKRNIIVGLVLSAAVVIVIVALVMWLAADISL